jgi:hypothetical protein
MSKPQKSAIQRSIDYLPAVLHEVKCGWRIEYYALNPSDESLKRVRVKVARLTERYRTKKEARAHCLQIVQTINAKLAGGWSPFFNTEDARLYTKMEDVAQKFLAEKRKELRSNTLRSYQSFCKMFLEWIQPKDMYCGLFTKIYAVRYMDYVYNERNNGVVTYNNQIKMGRAFFNWARERCYCKENPFENIKLKTKTRKTRTIIPPDVRERIKQYLLENDSNFLCVCELVYFSLIRPTK